MILDIDTHANVKLLNPNDFKEFHIQCSEPRSVMGFYKVIDLLQQGNKVIDEKHLVLCKVLITE